MKLKARTKEIVVQELDGETLVYDLRTHTACHLNETSAAVWRLCDGTRSVADIGRVLGQRSRSAVADETVLLALDQLSAKDLLDSAPEPLAGLHGSSRREVLKRIAMSSAIALPVIASIVVPTAAEAQSVVDCTACVKNNQTCTPACAGRDGTCYDNAGCGAGQTLGVETCATCKARTCSGGPGTCSWKGLT